MQPGERLNGIQSFSGSILPISTKHLNPTDSGAFFTGADPMRTPLIGISSTGENEQRLGFMACWLCSRTINLIIYMHILLNRWNREVLGECHRLFSSC